MYAQNLSENIFRINTGFFWARYSLNSTWPSSIYIDYVSTEFPSVFLDWKCNKQFITYSLGKNTVIIYETNPMDQGCVFGFLRSLFSKRYFSKCVCECVFFFVRCFKDKFQLNNLEHVSILCKIKKSIPFRWDYLPFI